MSETDKKHNKQDEETTNQQVNEKKKNEKRNSAKDFDYTTNPNIQNANREYNERLKKSVSSSTTEEKKVYVSDINYGRGVNPDLIENRKLDLSELYEKSARGGERNSDFTNTFGASESDITNLLNARNLTHSPNVIYRISEKTKESISVSGTYLYETTSAGNDFGQGVRMVNDMAYPVMHAITDRALMSCHKELLRYMAKDLNKITEDAFGKNAILIGNEELGMTENEVNKVIAELRRKLAEYGHGEFKGNGISSTLELKKYLRKNKDELTLPETKLLQALLKAETSRSIGNKINVKRRRFKIKTTMRLMRAYQKTDTGAGTLFTYNFIRRANTSVRLGLRLIRRTAKLTAISGKLMLKTAAKASAALAKTKLGKKIADSKLGKITKKAIDTSKKTTLGVREKIHQSPFYKARKAFEKRHEKYKKFKADPFNLKRKRNELLKKIRGSKVGKVLSPIFWIKRMAAYLFAGVITCISVVITFLMWVVLAFIIVILFFCLIAGILTSLMGLFDFTATEEEIQKAAFEVIEESYKEQEKQIKQLYDGQYRNVSVSYEDARSDDEYKKEENKPDEGFKETTNSAELLSMATIYFDYDLEEAGKEKVTDYIRKLYNGSHLLSIFPKPVYETNEKGETYIVATDVEAKLTTYYFNDLFECELMDTPGNLTTGTIGAGTTINVPQTFKQCITVTEYDKWVNIWGVTKNTGQRKIADEWTRQNQPFDNGWAYLKIGNSKRYLIACAETFGTTGDYVDVYFDNGTVFPCIIADMKSTKDPNYTEWGHKTGNAISVIEGEVSMAAFKQHGNPGKPSWWPQLDANVTKIVNGGSYFTNPSGPIKGVTGSGQLTNPCPKGRVTSEFGPRKPPTAGASSYHKGRDYGAPLGSEIIAADGGTVRTASNHPIRGNYIIVDHGNGMQTYYQHASTLLVKAGDKVVKGQKIATVGATGVSKGTHLHFEVHINKTPVDPRNYL